MFARVAGTRGQMFLTVACWILFGLSVLVMIAQARESGGDAATRGLGRAFAIAALPFVGSGLLLLLLSRGTFLRLLAMLLVSAPLLLVATMAGFARYGYLIRRHRESAGHLFNRGSGKELGQAIERNDLPRIRELIAGGADPNAAGPDGATPLSFALLRERLEAAKLLLELGADASLGQNYGRAPIMEMASNDKLSELLETALKHGANPNFVGDFGLPILQSAIGCRAVRNVELIVGAIVGAGARLDVRNEENHVAAPLAFAIQRRLWSMARLLVEHGAPLNEPPGESNIERAFSSVGPPAEGDSDRAEYDLLAEAMAKRGFQTPR